MFGALTSYRGVYLKVKKVGTSFFCLRIKFQKVNGDGIMTRYDDRRKNQATSPLPH
jgi:hypothetical protein